MTQEQGARATLDPAVMKPKLRDVLLAVIAFAAQLALLSRHGGPGLVPGDDHALDAGGVLLAAASTLPLAFWRSNVLAVFVLTTLASCTLNLLHYPPGPPVGATAALFLFAATGGMLRRALALVTVLLAAHVASAGIAERSFPTLPLVFGIVVWTLAVFVGDRVRLRLERRAALEQRARADERTRIARDLHDSVGHAINVILVQAGAARLLRERDPERSEAALETIEDVARQTISEIDALVRALRDDDENRGVETQPGLAALDTLLSRHRLTGLDVTVHHEGNPQPLPRRVDQAAYRILQEALTNAARYGTGHAEIDLRSSTEELELTVRNPVSDPAAGSAGHGHGLTGMRERAELLSGSLTTGLDDGSFVVRASLPLEAHA
jgi:signal transduction histidine kinase